MRTRVRCSGAGTNSVSVREAVKRRASELSTEGMLSRAPLFPGAGEDHTPCGTGCGRYAGDSIPYIAAEQPDQMRGSLRKLA